MLLINSASFRSSTGRGSKVSLRHKCVCSIEIVLAKNANPQRRCADARVSAVVLASFDHKDRDIGVLSQSTGYD